MSAAAQIIKGFGIQPGTVLATEISDQLSTAKSRALRETKLAPDQLAGGTELYLVSRGGKARATFTVPGLMLSVYGTSNRDGVFFCVGTQQPPDLDDGPFQFVVEGHRIRVYQLKRLVWQCGDADEE